MAEEEEEEGGGCGFLLEEEVEDGLLNIWTFLVVD